MDVLGTLSHGPASPVLHGASETKGNEALRNILLPLSGPSGCSEPLERKETSG